MKPFTPPKAARLIDEFLAAQTGNTRAAYAGDLADFALFAKADSAAAAVHELLIEGALKANALAERYKTSLISGRGLAPATVQRRMAALRAVTRHAAKAGVIPWALQVSNKVSQEKKDARMRTRTASLEGPPPEKIALLRAALDASGTLQSIRDRAVLDLAVDIAGRRGESASLNVEDLDLKAGTVSVVGKGRSSAETISLPAQTVRSLTRWLEVRPGSHKGPLFVRLDRGAAKGGKNQRLTTKSIYTMVRSLGDRVGIKRLHPHSLRHSSITEAVVYAGKSGISLDQVMQFSRHKSISTLLRYRDKRENLQLSFAAAVAKQTREGGTPSSASAKE